MAEFWEKLKTMVMGTPDEYDEEYDEYDEYDEEYEADYQDGRSSKPKFDFMRNFRRSNNDGEEEYEEERSFSRRTSSSGRNSNVIDINAKVKMSVVVSTPHSVEEASEIACDLLERKTVIVNLEGVERGTAQRITDFLSGTRFAIDGSIKQISSRIYVIGPYDVDITGEFKEELAANGINFPKSVFRKERKTY